MEGALKVSLEGQTAYNEDREERQTILSINN